MGFAISKDMKRFWLAIGVIVLSLMTWFCVITMDAKAPLPGQVNFQKLDEIYISPNVTDEQLPVNSGINQSGWDVYALDPNLDIGLGQTTKLGVSRSEDEPVGLPTVLINKSYLLVKSSGVRTFCPGLRIVWKNGDWELLKQTRD